MLLKLLERMGVAVLSVVALASVLLSLILSVESFSRLHMKSSSSSSSASVYMAAGRVPFTPYYLGRDR